MAVQKGLHASSAASGANEANGGGRRQTVTVVIGLIMGLVIYEAAFAGSGDNRPQRPPRPDPLIAGGNPDGEGDDGASVPAATASSKKRADALATAATKVTAGASADGSDGDAAATSSEKRTPITSTGRALVPSDPATHEACWPACYPWTLRSGTLFVHRKPHLSIEPSLMRVSAVKPDSVTGKPVFSFGPGITRVALDIGTHADPDTQSDWWSESDLGMIWFEPIVTLHTHPMHLAETRAVQGIDRNRVVGIPAAVAPKPGHMAIFLSAVSGCTSLLEMNDQALRDPSVMKGSFVGSDSSFPDWSTAKSGFTGCIEKVKGRANREVVPVIRGDDVVNMIPKELEVTFLATDAQGFDLHVVSSFGNTLDRIDLIVVECQDLPEGHGMFLTRGAFSCADIRACMKQYSPNHEMVAAANGEPANSCTINNPSHERNCLFRKKGRPFFRKTPKLLTRKGYDIAHPTRAELKCPSLERPEGLVEVAGGVE
jgi:hypothetical protein